jgi:hypothetical protein
MHAASGGCAVVAAAALLLCRRRGSRSDGPIMPSRGRWIGELPD